jgi:PAS domain S-box-containing protein
MPQQSTSPNVPAHLGFSLPIEDEQLSHIRYALDESAIVAVTNVQGVITYVNDTFCAVSGYNRDELIGATHRIINSGYHPSSFFKEMWETIGDCRVWRGEVQNRSKNGSHYWVYTTIVPKCKKDLGHPLETNHIPQEYTAIRFDITPLKRVEAEIQGLYNELDERVHQRTAQLASANAELEALLERLKETEQQRERYVAAITHDLRTPLIGQQRALSIVAKHQHLLPPSVQPFLQSMATSTDHTLALVQKLLDVHHLESGHVVPVVQAVRVKDLIDTAFADVLPLASERNITLINSTNPAELLAKLDPRLIRRVLVNLLGNSLALPTCKSITVSACNHPEGLTLSVRDDGPGIPSERLPKLFERHWGEKTRQIGTGLGLNICKLIVERHGGSLSVESHTQSPNHGTTFTLFFPSLTIQ